MNILQISYTITENIANLRKGSDSCNRASFQVDGIIKTTVEFA
jgi:hypothetical protein